MAKISKKHYFSTGILLLIFLPILVSAQTESRMGIEQGDFFDYRFSDTRFSMDAEVRITILKIEDLSYSSDVKFKIAGTDYGGNQGGDTKTDNIIEYSEEYDRISIVYLGTDLLGWDGGFFIPKSKAPDTLRVLSVEDDVDITLVYDSDGVLTKSTMSHDGDTITYTLTDSGHRDGTPFIWFLQDYWYLFVLAGIVMTISISSKVISKKKTQIKTGSARDYSHWIPHLTEEVKRVEELENKEAKISHLADYIYALDQKVNGVMSRIQSRSFATKFLENQGEK